MVRLITPQSLRRATALALVAVLLCPLHASAGIIIRGTQGITFTGADGIYYDNVSGVTFTGADALTYQVNGITGTTTSGVTFTGADGNRVASVDGVAYTGANSYAATGADGVTFTGADGTTWKANSVVVRQPNGVTFTGADGVTFTGADGVTFTGADGVTFTGADGTTMAGVQSAYVNGAGQVVGTRLDGTTFNASTNGVTFTGADGVTVTGGSGVSVTGADGFRMLGYDGVTFTGADTGAGRVGLMGFDPQLASKLDLLTDDGNVNAAVVYHHAVSDSDIATLKALGVRGGTRFQTLPVVVVTATKGQVSAISELDAVRYITDDRTLQWNADNSREQTGLLRVRQDHDLRRVSGVNSFQGNGVTVAVLDTGLDSTHPDISNRVLRNVKLADLQGANPVEFLPPANVEKLPDTDTLSGHGTFVG
ncbi:MAG: S8 family serine peptidase, partial [Pyrinomonadaceae bacterium]